MTAALRSAGSDSGTERVLVNALSPKVGGLRPVSVPRRLPHEDDLNGDRARWQRELH